MALTVSAPGVPAIAGKDPDAPSSLFREEAVEFHQIARQYGGVVLLQPLSSRILSWAAIIFTTLIVAFLVTGQYSRKATVSGYLVPAPATAKVFPLQRGVITKVHVREGEAVPEGQPLLTIDTTQISAAGDDINSVILQTLSIQEEELNQQIKKEEQRMVSERERLSLLINGLNAEIGQLEAQIPLQANKIALTQDLVTSIEKLVAKGIVSVVEFKRRQSDVLDQKQNLNSIRQQLSARQNQLTDTKYNLSQLPVTSAEKTQPLRNELSAIKQRIAEINGRRAFVIRAPMAGHVTALQASLGKVAEPNQLQMEIVPPSSILNAEVFIPSHAIGFVQVGQPVRVRYEAFPYQNFGRYEGKLAAMSQNILNAAEMSSVPVTLQEPAYRATVALDRQDIDAYGKKMPLQAGMLLKADLILDRRSLLRWVLDPLLSAQK
jgi:membrane fusion protein